MIHSRKAMICGISGQDGSYLANFLIKKGYVVVGTSRDSHAGSFGNLKKLGILDKVKVVSMALNDFRSVIQILSEVEPDEIYNLSGQSSVALSFEQPVETLDSISLGTINLLEGVRFLKKDVKIYNASSSECFGNTGILRANEETPFKPTSPYAVAKSAAHWQVASYRSSYNLFACSGILFNHESPFRNERFVTQKIVQSAFRISKGVDEKLTLGNLDIERDWGWAPEYVEAMWLMLQHDVPDDFVIATGKSFTLTNYLECVFSNFNLNWQEYVEVNEKFVRPSDNKFSRADPSKAKEIIAWQAKSFMPDIVEKMVSNLNASQ